MKKLFEKFSNELILRIGFAISIGVLILASFFSYETNRTLVSNAYWVDHTSQVISKLNGMLISIKDAQLSQKNFLMMNDEKYLAQYYSGKEKFNNDLESLKVLTADNAEQQIPIKEIERLFGIYYEKLDKLIYMKRMNSYIYDPLSGIYEIEMLVSMINKMKSNELLLMDKRTKEFDSSTIYAPLLIALFSLLALGFTIVFYLIIANNLKSIKNKELSLQEAYEEVQAINEEMNSTNEELKALNEELNENRDQVEAFKNRLLEAQEIANIGNWEWNIESNHIYWSDQLIKMFDFHPSDNRSFDYETYLTLIHPDDKQLVIDAVEKIMKDYQPYRLEHRIIKSDGGIAWILAKGKVVLSHNGKLVKLAGTSLDITELKYAQTEEQKLVAVIENSIDFIGLSDDSGKIIFINRAGQKLIGANLSKKKTSIQILDLLQPEGYTFFNNHIMPMVLEKGKWSGELNFKSLDTHEPIPVCWNVFLVTDKVDNGIGIGHVVQDMRVEKKIRQELQVKNEELSAVIEELKQAEENLLSMNRDLEDRVAERRKDLVISEERFRIVSLATNDAIWDWDLQTDKLWWNEGFKTMFGYKNDQIEPGIESLQNRIHPDDKDRIIKEIRKFLISGKSQWKAEYRFLNSVGKYIDVMERGYAIYNELGKPYRMLGSLINITERKEFENERAKLHEQAEAQRTRLYKLLMNIPAAITIMKGKDYVYEVANDQYKLLIGEPEGDLVGKSRKSLKLFEGPDKVIELMDKIYETGQPFFKTEFPADVARNGKKEKAYFNLLLEPIYDNDQKIEGIMTFAVEVTDQVMARKNIEENAERSRLMLEAMPQMAWTSDLNGEVVFFNAKWYEYTEASFDQLKGWGWIKFVHPDDQQLTNDLWKQALATGQICELEYRLKRSSDSTYRWMLVRALALKNSSGQILKWVGTSTDIHDQKVITNDLDKKNQELVKVNELLDTFVYTAAHDLKSPVINLKGLIELIKETEDTVTKEEYFNTVNVAVKRLDDTINGLVEVIEVQSEDNKIARETDFEDTLEVVLTDFSETLMNINGMVNYDFKQRPNIIYLKSYLNSIFTNLIGNAIKYRSENKPLSINITSFINKEFVVLEFKDNGIGIDLSKNGNKIFKAFNRFSRNAEGKGLGLYLIKTMVERNGGKLEVESTLNAGTTFKVYLKEYV